MLDEHLVLTGRHIHPEPLHPRHNLARFSVEEAEWPEAKQGLDRSLNRP